MKTLTVKRFFSFACLFGALCLVMFIRHQSVPAVHAQTAGCTDQALALAEGQVTDTLVYTSTTQFPVATNPANSNKWNLASSSQWTSGFFPGLLWYMYERTLGDSWMTRATAQTASMESQDVNASDHDIGFKILGSYGNAYRITRDPAYMNVIQTAAQSMSTLYRPGAGVIESWPNFDSHITVIVDNMMNLELLFFAAQNGGDPNWYNMAVSHAVKTMQNHVRADGSTYHVVDYNPDGTVFSKFTVQGAGNETTWSRGQAWAIYGFTMTYRYTKDPRFLATAQSLADYFINHLPPDFVPYWDFSKCCTDPRDSSAAAIAAAGLLELSTYVAPTDQTRYHTAALNIQSSLSSPTYLGDRLATDGVLLHGSANVPGNSGVDVSLIYGDYYFVQGCHRATSPPPAPTNLTATATSGTAALAWDAETGAIRYSVKRSTTSGGPYTTIAPPPVLTANNFTDTGLNPNTTYYYVVSAIGVGGEGSDSLQTSATTPNSPAPIINALVPSGATAGGPAFAMTVNGANFAASSVVKFKGNAKPTTFVSSTQIRAAFATADIAAAGSFPVTVVNSSSSQASNSAAFTVSKAATSTTLISSLNPAVFGRAVTFTATVKPSTSSVPTGAVTFKDGSVSIGSGTLSNGKATLVKSNLAARSHSLTAVYPGDANHTGSASAALTQTITKAGTVASVFSSLNPSHHGNTVTFTALVRSTTTGLPTGVVTFKDGATTLGTRTLNSAGKGALAISTLAIGSHSITAVYGGDANFKGSISVALKQTVNP